MPISAKSKSVMNASEENSQKAPQNSQPKNAFLSVQTAKNVGYYVCKAAKIATKLGMIYIGTEIRKETISWKPEYQSDFLPYRTRIICISSIISCILLKSVDNDCNKPCAKTINYLVSPILKKLTSQKTEKTN